MVAIRQDFVQAQPVCHMPWQDASLFQTCLASWTAWPHVRTWGDAVVCADLQQVLQPHKPRLPLSAPLSCQTRSAPDLSLMPLACSRCCSHTKPITPPLAWGASWASDTHPPTVFEGPASVTALCQRLTSLVLLSTPMEACAAAAAAYPHAAGAHADAAPGCPALYPGT
jgi:hypothetical protein